MADGLIVGGPIYPVYSREQFDTYLGWIADEINVDQKPFEIYYESLATLPSCRKRGSTRRRSTLRMDAAVQAVLSRADADPAVGLLKAAQEELEARISFDDSRRRAGASLARPCTSERTHHQETFHAESPHRARGPISHCLIG